MISTFCKDKALKRIKFNFKNHPLIQYQPILVRDEIVQSFTVVIVPVK